MERAGQARFSNKQLLVLHTTALGRPTPAILHGMGDGAPGHPIPRWHTPPAGGGRRVGGLGCEPASPVEVERQTDVRE